MKAILPSPLLLRAGLRYQLRHPWQALLALSGIVMGVAIVLAVDLANGAAKASFDLSAQQLRGAATHRLIGTDGSVAETLYRRFFTTPGHPPMAPVIQTPVKIEGRAGRFRLIGIDLFAERGFRDTLPEAIREGASMSDWLSRPDLIALSRSAAQWLSVSTGDRLTLRYRETPFTVEVAAIGADTTVGSRDFLVTDIATAQTIAGMGGRLSHVDVVPGEAGLAWLQARLPPDVRLVSIDQQTRDITRLSAAFELNLTAMSLLALLVGIFLIFNAVSFSIVQRRRLFGRLRAIGVRTGELYRLVFAEALVLGLVGTVIGGLVGVALGSGLTGIVAATVGELYYEVTADALRLDAAALLKAGLLGLAGTLLAAGFPARQAAATPPLTTLSRAALEDSTRRHLPRLAAAGTLLALAGLLTAFRAPGGVLAGFAGLFVLLLGTALATPYLLHLAHRLLDRLPLSGIGRMAARDLDRHLSRLGTATAALMVALSASIGVAVMVESMRTSVSDWLGSLLTADLYVAPSGFDEGATLPRGIFDAATTLPPVDDFSSYRRRQLQLRDGPLTVIAARLAPASRAGFRFIASGPVPWDAYDRGAVLVSEPLAHRLGIGPGDTLQLPAAAGEVAFPVAAVFRDYASEHGRVFIDRGHYRSHWDDSEVNTLALFSHAGGDALAAAAAERLDHSPPLVLTRATAIHQESMAVFDRTFRITEVLRLLSLLVAFIGVLSALMAVQLERRKEYAVLRALGLTRGQLGRLIAIESVLLGLLAGLLAIPTGLVMAWVLTAAIQLRAFGWSMPFLVPSGPLLSTVSLGVLAALLASAYPAWRSARYPPAPQLRED